MESRQTIIVDTGPIVAFLRRDEADHAWAAKQFITPQPPFHTCEPVLAEACYLASQGPDGIRRFFELLASGWFVVDFHLMDEQDRLAELVGKYHDLPMSLADARLVRMSELTPNAIILTLDSHFRIYREHGRKALSVIMP